LHFGLVHDGTVGAAAPSIYVTTVNLGHVWGVQNVQGAYYLKRQLFMNEPISPRGSSISSVYRNIRVQIRAHQLLSIGVWAC
jgi:hypothetical protein